jgi:hypothetical protein
VRHSARECSFPSGHQCGGRAFVPGGAAPRAHVSRTARGFALSRGLRYGRTMAPAGEGERVMRALCDAFNRLDPASANPWLEPDVEVHDYPGFPDREWHHGYEGVLGWAAKLQRAGTDLISTSSRATFNRLAMSSSTRGALLGRPVVVAFPWICADLVSARSAWASSHG